MGSHRENTKPRLAPLNQEASNALKKEFAAKTRENLSRQELDNGMKLITRDKKGNPLKSVFEWSDDAAARILRVPSGFMRSGVQTNVEGLALEGKALLIDLELVEKGIEKGLEPCGSFEGCPARSGMR